MNSALRNPKAASERAFRHLNPNPEGRSASVAECAWLSHLFRKAGQPSAASRAGITSRISPEAQSLFGSAPSRVVGAHTMPIIAAHHPHDALCAPTTDGYTRSTFYTHTQVDTETQEPAESSESRRVCRAHVLPES